DLGQAPVKLGAAGQPAADLLARRPAVLPVLLELAVESRRRHFEVVAPLDHRGSVQHVSQLPAQAFAVADPDAARLVDVQSEHAPRSEPPPIQVDQLQSVATDHRRDRLLDQGDPFDIVHGPRARRPTPPSQSAKTKKSGLSPLFQEFSTCSDWRQGGGILIPPASGAARTLDGACYL